MSLTAELVARCHRAMEDPGPEPGLPHLDEDDYRAIIGSIQAHRPPGGDFWIFAYGSLIWKPEAAHLEERIATAHGYHRAFCIRLRRWRGTIEQPGLMMGLARGGQCTGVAFRLPQDDVAGAVSRLVRREMTAKPTTYRPAWLRLATAAGPVSALGFVVNPAGRTYAGRLDEAEVAAVLARACGHVGSGADYLFNTVGNLEARGIHDRGLWRLQQRVADEIRRLPREPGAP
jgi:cation transport protein ChaC